MTARLGLLVYYLGIVSNPGLKAGAQKMTYLENPFAID